MRIAIGRSHVGSSLHGFLFALHGGEHRFCAMPADAQWDDDVQLVVDHLDVLLAHGAIAYAP